MAYFAVTTGLGQGDVNTLGMTGQLNIRDIVVGERDPRRWPGTATAA